MGTMRFRGLAVLLLVVVAGCATADSSVSVEASGLGSAPGSSVASKAVLSATDATSAVNTGRFSLTTSLGGAGDQVTTLQGAFDRAHKALQIDTAAASSRNVSMSMRSIDGIVYLDLAGLGGPFADLIGVKTPWVSIDVSKLAAGRGLGDIAPGFDAEADPTSVLDALRGVSGEVTAVGTEQVQGVSTTHYVASVIPAKAIVRLPAARRDQLRTLLGGDVDTVVPVEVWIGSDGLLREATINRQPGSVGKASISIEFFDLGKPVSIAAPPADQVTPGESVPFLKQLLGN